MTRTFKKRLMATLVLAGPITVLPLLFFARAARRLPVCLFRAPA